MIGNHYLGSGQIEALRSRVTFTLAHLWRVERLDGAVARFASHDKWIRFQREDYRPVGPMASDLEQSEAGAESDFEVIGFLSAESIRPSDIHAGRYDGCSITHWVVDWMRPWVWLRKHRWWVKDINEDGSVFQARVQGVERFLTFPVGRRYERECDKVLGSAECGAVPVVQFGAVVQAVAAPGSSILGSSQSDTAIAITTASWPAVPRNGLMAQGKVVWTSGPNKGTQQRIGEQVSRSLLLEQPAPFRIKPGDVCTIFSGCDGTESTCRFDYANRINFGGIAFMPSTSDTYRKAVEK
jgi:uncharacterized phage protein (TIGR02218 family)